MGSVKHKVIKCIIVGAAGVGKTSIKHLLLNKKLPEKRRSTGVAENPARAVSISQAIMTTDDNSWYVVDSDENLIKMIAEMIKTEAHNGKPQEESDATQSVAHEKPLVTGTASESMTVNSAKPESQDDSISNDFISAIMEAKGMY